MTLVTQNRRLVASPSPPSGLQRHAVAAAGREQLTAWTFAAATAVLALVFGIVFAQGVHAAAAEVALATFLAAAGTAVVPLTLLSSREIGVVASLVALCSAAAAAIHFVAVDKQGNGYWLFLAAFAALSVFQLVWALVLLVRPSTLAYATGLLANAATVFIWAYSRGVNVPIGPDAGKPEAVAFGDVVSTVLEALIVVGTTWL